MKNGYRLVLLSGLVGSLASLVGCAGGTPPAELPPEGLRLTSVSAEHLIGTYREGDAGVRIDSWRTASGTWLHLRSMAGVDLVRIDSGQGGVQISILGHRADIRVPQRGLELLRQAIQDPASPAGGPSERALLESSQIRGDLNAYQTLAGTAEYHLLPALSRALGLAGYTGVDYPGALPIHMLAMMEPQPATQPDPLRARSASASQENGQCHGIDDDPHQNACFGMCGDACSCWNWVCGDCCFHSACAFHDYSCRRCSAALPFACLTCGHPMVLAIATFGC